MLSCGCRGVILSSLVLMLWGCASNSDAPAGTGGKGASPGTGGVGSGTGGASTTGSGGNPSASGGAPGATGGTSSGGASATGGTGTTGTGGGLSDGGVTDAATGGTGGGSATGGISGGGTGGGGGTGLTTCGAARPSLAGITGLEGLVIGPDGTIYFTRPGTNFLGRYQPPYTQPELTWADMKGGAFGIALDPKLHVIYAGSRPLKKLVKIVVSDPPVVSNLVDVEATINGVTLGEDGAVYYTDQGSGQVYRVTAEGAKTQVTTSPVLDANGIAFGPDGGLFVLTYAAAKVTRLTLTTGKETARTAFATITGGRNADGIAFDASGNLYITATGMFKISANGQTQSALSCGTVGSANVDFGAGALACTDIYSAGNGGLFRCANTTAGMNVPWHRAN